MRLLTQRNTKTIEGPVDNGFSMKNRCEMSEIPSRAHSPRDFISFAAGHGNGAPNLSRFCGTFKAYYNVKSV